MKNLANEKTNLPEKTFGTLYHRSMDSASGSISLAMRADTKKEKFQRIIGAGLTSVAMALYIYSYGPIASEQVTPQAEREASGPSIVQASEGTIVETSTGEPISQKFTVTIPYLKTSADIIENVNALVESEYSEALERGVAHAAGTGLPGSGSRIFLFAHSTNSPFNIARFNAVFYGLNTMPVGEQITIHKDGTDYTYVVSEKKIIAPTDTSWLEPKEGEELVLQTCHPPGTSWKRLLVIAKPL